MTRLSCTAHDSVEFRRPSVKCPEEFKDTWHKCHTCRSVQVRRVCPHLEAGAWTSSGPCRGFKDASIAHLYREKGNRHFCDNHRGISLLSIAGKILAMVVLNRFILHFEQGHSPKVSVTSALVEW